MNTRFALPVAAALAVHATLLFGFRRAHHPREKITLAKTIDKPFELPPEIEIVDPSRDKHDVTKGSPDAPRPEPERIERPSTEIDFPVNPTPPAPPREDLRRSLTWEQYGSPEGTKLDPTSIVTQAMLDNPPRARVQASPDYPFAAKKEGLDGEVVVEFLVDETGHVSNPMVIRSTNRVFEESSLRAVLKWRFEPGRRDGRLVRFRMMVPVVFRLNDN